MNIRYKSIDCPNGKMLATSNPPTNLSIQIRAKLPILEGLVNSLNSPIDYSLNQYRFDVSKKKCIAASQNSLSPQLNAFKRVRDGELDSLLRRCSS